MAKHLLDVEKVMGFRELCGGFPVAQCVEMNLIYSLIFQSGRDPLSLASEISGKMPRGKSRGTVLYHLKKLRSDKFVSEERVRKKVFFRLRPEYVSFVSNLQQARDGFS